MLCNILDVNTDEAKQRCLPLKWGAAGIAVRRYAASAGLQILRRSLRCCSVHLRFITVGFQTPVR